MYMRTLKFKKGGTQVRKLYPLHHDAVHAEKTETSTKEHCRISYVTCNKAFSYTFPIAFRCRTFTLIPIKLNSYLYYIIFSHEMCMQANSESTCIHNDVYKFLYKSAHMNIIYISGDNLYRIVSSS